MSIRSIKRKDLPRRDRYDLPSYCSVSDNKIGRVEVDLQLIRVEELGHDDIVDDAPYIVGDSS